MSGSNPSWASSPSARATMRANRRRDTHPELRTRRLVHAAGLRYRVDARPLPSVNRRADMVFTRAKVAVFIDGCFWHSCPSHGTAPQANAAFWQAKFASNRARDTETDSMLREAGWISLRIWEHVEASEAAAIVITAVRQRLANLREADPPAP